MFKRLFNKGKKPSVINIPIEETGVDFLTIIISKEEVLASDINPTLSTLSNCIKSVEAMRHFKERVDIFFDGYNEDRRALWEIEHVRDFVRKLDEQFPYWLFFLSKEGQGLRVIINCFLSPYLTLEGQRQVHPRQLENYLFNRGFPAVNFVVDAAGLDEQENERITESVMAYLNK